MSLVVSPTSCDMERRCMLPRELTMAASMPQPCTRSLAHVGAMALTRRRTCVTPSLISPQTASNAGRRSFKCCYTYGIGVLYQFICPSHRFLGAYTVVSNLCNDHRELFPSSYHSRFSSLLVALCHRFLFFIARPSLGTHPG